MLLSLLLIVVEFVSDLRWFVEADINSFPLHLRSGIFVVGTGIRDNIRFNTFVVLNPPN